MAFDSILIFFQVQIIYHSTIPTLKDNSEQAPGSIPPLPLPRINLTKTEFIVKMHPSRKKLNMRCRDKLV